MTVLASAIRGFEKQLADGAPWRLIDEPLPLAKSQRDAIEAEMAAANDPDDDEDASVIKAELREHLGAQVSEARTLLEQGTAAAAVSATSIAPCFRPTGQ
jgi:hypothetical protein